MDSTTTPRNNSHGEPPRRSRRLRGGRPSYPGGMNLQLQRSDDKQAGKDVQSSAKPFDGTNDLVAEDDLCPICQLLLYRPVTTRCNHTMCEACMAHWAEVSVSQMPIVDVDEEPESFNPVSGIEAKCPMCRTQTPATFNPDMANRLAGAYPKLWQERRLEDEADANEFDEVVQTLTVYIGNRHRIMNPDDDDEDVRTNNHEWTFFVRPSRTDIIKEVHILLHPTFRPSHVIRRRAPYEFEAEGWGHFTIVAHVVLNAGYCWVSSEAQESPDGAPKRLLPLEWTLDFNGFGGKGSMGRCRLKVSNDR